MECCGDPFDVGSEVEWTVAEPDRDWLSQVLGDEIAWAIDAAEEHHGPVDTGDLRLLRATVERIDAVFCCDGDRGGHPVRGSGVLRPIPSTQRRIDDADADLRFVGYLVELRDAAYEDDA
jgi:hypothetical protein